MAATMTTPGRLSCPPRFGTPRNLDRLTLGPQVGEVARRLGMPLMEWQQHVLDVALELDDDGGLAYSELVLTAPRQNGKTAIVLSKLVHRALAIDAFGGPQGILYTAQDRNYARKKWMDDHVARLRRAKRSFREGRDYDVRLSNGSEAIEWTNGSRHGICAPTDTAAHGDTLDEGVIDEAFAHEDDAVEQGMSPAMITRRNKQFFVLSTAGNAKSRYLYRKVLAGRKMTTTGADTPVAYFEWSAPDDLPIDDPATWQLANPAFGMTITEAALAAEYQRLSIRGEAGLNQFRRAHLNQWVDVPLLEEAFETVWAEGTWAAVCSPRVTRPAEGIVFGLDVNPDRNRSAITIAGGGGTCGLVDERPGVGWALAEAERLSEHYGAPVAVLGRGPAAAYIGDLERAGVDVLTVTREDYERACGWFYDAVEERSIRVRRDERLDAAVLAAAKKTSGDRFVWDRKATGEVTSLVALTIAAWAAVQTDEDDGATTIW
jgi:hypothetical protein